MNRLRALVVLLGGLTTLALVVPGLANAQASRTWVSGVGDDANPCSRTAPCKTFAGAISKTASGGEINCLDPGGFGAVTITKSITISCSVGTAGVLVSGTNGVVVNGANIDVTLKGLDFDGLTTGLNGVEVVQAHSVKVIDSDIYGFQNAVYFEPSNVGAELLVQNSNLINNSQDAVLVAPQNHGSAKATVRNNQIGNNGCGIVASAYGVAAFDTTACGTNSSGSSIGAAIVNSFGNTITNQTGAGVLARGTVAYVRLGANQIITNVTGLKSVDSGQILSFGNNMVTGNHVDGAPTGAVISLI